MAQLLKRATDVIVSLLGLIVMAPMMAVVALVIRLTMGAPVVFRQLRPGYHAVPFTVYKFRTMREALDEQGQPLPDEQRLTAIGQLLRKTSLDEFPQLWNVLKGEMSLVGPRPLLVEYLELYTPEQARRHDVRPGITGWAQVNGRNATTWEQRFQQDVWYVDNWSLCLDAKILLSTFVKVVRREGTSQPGAATMEKFTGTPGPDGTALEPEETT